MHRFFVSTNSISGSRVSLTGGIAAQIAQVLRGRPRDTVIVLDDTGMEYRVMLDYVSVTQVGGEVIDSEMCAGEPDVEITLYQAIIKGDKFEYVLQKCTELGVSAFVPVICERSIPNPRKWGNGRYERWRLIVREAAEQSRRGRVPRVDVAIGFKDACENHVGSGVIPWEMESHHSLKQVLGQLRERDTGPSRIGIFIGPEGGLTCDEVDFARAKGILPATLGPRILRAETASVAVSAAVMYELDELEA